MGSAAADSAADVELEPGPGLLPSCGNFGDAAGAGHHRVASDAATREPAQQVSHQKALLGQANLLCQHPQSALQLNGAAASDWYGIVDTSWHHRVALDQTSGYIWVNRAFSRSRNQHRCV